MSVARELVGCAPGRSPAGRRSRRRHAVVTAACACFTFAFAAVVTRPVHAAAAPVVLFEVNDVEGAEDPTRRLDVTVDGRTFAGPSAPEVSIEAQRDFNGDGLEDALVATSQGGNCCAPAYSFVGVVRGRLVVAAITEDWGVVDVVERDGKALVRQKTPDATTLYAFDGTRAVKMSETAKLAALKEIAGAGAMYSGPETERQLVFDLDENGQPETLRCDIWPRWGTLVNCDLPLPGGRKVTLELSCDRLGVLAAKHHGWHDVVCGNDTVVAFDGRTWKTVP